MDVTEASSNTVTCMFKTLFQSKVNYSAVYHSISSASPEGLHSYLGLQLIQFQLLEEKALQPKSLKTIFTDSHTDIKW